MLLAVPAWYLHISVGHCGVSGGTRQSIASNDDPVRDLVWLTSPVWDLCVSEREKNTSHGNEMLLQDTTYLMVVAFSSLTRILGECSTIHTLPAL